MSGGVNSRFSITCNYNINSTYLEEMSGFSPMFTRTMQHGKSIYQGKQGLALHENRRESNYREFSVVTIFFFFFFFTFTNTYLF